MLSNEGHRRWSLHRSDLGDGYSIRRAIEHVHRHELSTLNDCENDNFSNKTACFDAKNDKTKNVDKKIVDRLSMTT